MNSKIYGKLAVTNLKNNRKSYIPYILASAFSVMMYFIMDNLCLTEISFVNLKKYPAVFNK